VVHKLLINYIIYKITLN